MKFWLRTLLREENKDGDGGGGLTLESLKALLAESATATKAVIGEAVQAATKPLNDTIAALKDELAEVKKVATAKTPEPKPEPKPKGKEDDKSIELPPEIQSTIDGLKAQTAEQAKTIDALKKDNETRIQAARTASMDKAVTDAIAGVQFVDDFSRDLAYGQIRSKVAMADDGTITFDGKEPKAFVTEFVKAAKTLLQPASNGGAGAKGGGDKSTSFDIDNIKPGMSAEDQKAYAAHLAGIVQQSIGS